jgi:class 3 adenylate cyclase
VGLKLPEVRYARSGEVAIAYQVIGEGRTDVVFVRHMSGDLLSTWEQPLLVRHVDGLAANGRLLLLDRRGTGLSDRVREVQSLETTMDDIRAVMDDAGSERAVLWTGLHSTGLGILFAATYPDRCAGLMLLDPQARGTASEEYPWAPAAEEWRARLRTMRTGWGDRSYLEAMAREWAPEMADDEGFIDWLVWHMRRSLSPGAALTAYRTAMEVDVTDVLAAVRVPTLILARPTAIERARWMAKRISGARLLELPWFEGIFTWVVDEVHDATMRATSEFIGSLASPADHERLLATILFTDIVGSTEVAARLGDAEWRNLLVRHHALVRRELARFNGIELDTAGDGFFATFDGPARAITAAMAIRDAVASIGIEVRAGLHTGECEVHDGKVTGIAVAIGARIAAMAEPGEVLVSSTVRDLVAGSGRRFEERGDRELKGVPGTWTVFRVVEAAGESPGTGAR